MRPTIDRPRGFARTLLVLLLASVLPVLPACLEAPPPTENSGRSNGALPPARNVITVSTLDEALALPVEQFDPGLACLILAYEAGEATIDEVQQSREFLIALADRVQARYDINTDDRDKCDYVVEAVFEAGFRFDRDDPEGHKAENLFLNRVIARRLGYCLSLSMVALAVAYYADAPLHGVRLPNHFFVRYRDYADFADPTNGIRGPRNYEMTSGGAEIADSEYFRRYVTKPSVNAVGKKAYLFSLDNKRAMADVFTNFGSLALVAGKPAEADRRYTRGLALDTTSPQLWYNRGVARQRIDNYTGAISDFHEAIELDPGFYQAYCARGRLYCEAGDPNTGFEDLEDATRLRPDDPEAYTIRGVCYARLERYDEATADLTRAVELAPTDPLTRFNLALMLVQAQRYDEAVPAIDAFLRVAPDHPNAAQMEQTLQRLRAEGFGGE